MANVDVKFKKFLDFETHFDGTHNLKTRIATPNSKWVHCCILIRILCKIRGIIENSTCCFAIPIWESFRFIEGSGSEKSGIQNGFFALRS